MQDEKIVLIDGCRTAFLRSGTDFVDLMSYQLGQFAIRGLCLKTRIDLELIDRVILGTTISNVKTSNVAREAAIAAGIPSSTPCHTVTMACISANQAITSGIDLIRTGQAEVVIAGGTDSVSDAPIQFNKAMRKKLFNARNLKGIADYLKFALTLRPKDFVPQAPAIAEFITNRTMGEDCDMMAGRYQIDRSAQDEFAVRSHQLAAKAVEQGHITSEIVPVEIPPKFTSINQDNGIRPDTSIDKIKQLKPAFVKPYGTLTAANSSFLTDGAAVVMITSESKAKALGLMPKASVHSFAYSGQDLETELLLGPAFAIDKLLKQSSLSLNDIDVFEFHEAFAAQLLANIKCMASEKFAKSKLDSEQAIGHVPMDKLNLWGGSLSLGHPFGATGARLMTTAANRLKHEKGRYALIAACAAGAHGHAMIIENYH